MTLHFFSKWGRNASCGNHICPWMRLKRFCLCSAKGCATQILLNLQELPLATSAEWLKNTIWAEDRATANIYLTTAQKPKSHGQRISRNELLILQNFENHAQKTRKSDRLIIHRCYKKRSSLEKRVTPLQKLAKNWEDLAKLFQSFLEDTPGKNSQYILILFDKTILRVVNLITTKGEL